LPHAPDLRWQSLLTPPPPLLQMQLQRRPVPLFTATTSPQPLERFLLAWFLLKVVCKMGPQAEAEALSSFRLHLQQRRLKLTTRAGLWRV
jgi:hypothetical protein